MALSIKTAEADALARRLARVTGESMTEAVTIALRERLAREEAKYGRRDNLADRLERLCAKFRPEYDVRPVTKAEWDAISGEAP